VSRLAQLGAGLSRRLRARWRIPVVLALLGAFAGAAWGLADVPEYRAGATVVPADRGEAGAEGAFDTSDPEALDRLVQIARGRQVALVAAAALGGDLSGGDILATTSVGPGPGGSISIRVTAENPALPPAVADAYAESVVEVVAEREQERLESAEEELGEQLLELDPLSEEYAELEARIAEIGELRALGEPLELGRGAGEASSLGDRSAAAWATGGALAGLLAGLLVAAIAGARRPRRERIADAEAFAAVSGLDPIVLPRIDRALGEGEGAVSLSGEGGEALHALARELGLLGADTEPQTVAVCSAERGEGRTSLALGLAAAAAEAGRRVVLVEGDLREPALATRLGLEPAPGFGDFLAGEARPREMVRRVHVEDAREQARARMLCVVAGPPRTDGEELLGGRRPAVLVERLLRAYDVVIFDTPPLLEAADGGQLAALAERTLLVAVANRTRSERLRAALPALPEYLNGILLGGGRRRIRRGG
jgi:Mrp family chromosome partitioning ATPase